MTRLLTIASSVLVAALSLSACGSRSKIKELQTAKRPTPADQRRCVPDVSDKTDPQARRQRGRPCHVVVVAAESGHSEKSVKPSQRDLEVRCKGVDLSQRAAPSSSLLERFRIAETHLFDTLIPSLPPEPLWMSPTARGRGLDNSWQLALFEANKAYGDIIERAEGELAAAARIRRAQLSLLEILDTVIRFRIPPPFAGPALRYMEPIGDAKRDLVPASSDDVGACSDTVWTRLGQGLPHNLPRLEGIVFLASEVREEGACPLASDVAALADLPSETLRRYRELFATTLQNVPTPLAPRTRSEAERSLNDIARRAEALVVPLDRMQALAMGPHTVRSMMLGAEVYGSWAKQVSDIPVPKTLLDAPPSYDPKSPLRQWEAEVEHIVESRRGRARERLNGALTLARALCLDESVRAEIQAALDALPHADP